MEYAESAGKSASTVKPMILLAQELCGKSPNGTFFVGRVVRTLDTHTTRKLVRNG